MKIWVKTIHMLAMLVENELSRVSSYPIVDLESVVVYQTIIIGANIRNSQLKFNLRVRGLYKPSLID